MPNVYCRVYTWRMTRVQGSILLRSLAHYHEVRARPTPWNWPICSALKVSVGCGMSMRAFPLLPLWCTFHDRATVTGAATRRHAKRFPLSNFSRNLCLLSSETMNVRQSFRPRCCAKGNSPAPFPSQTRASSISATRPSLEGGIWRLRTGTLRTGCRR